MSLLSTQYERWVRSGDVSYRLAGVMYEIKLALDEAGDATATVTSTDVELSQRATQPVFFTQRETCVALAPCGDVRQLPLPTHQALVAAATSIQAQTRAAGVSISASAAHVAAWGAAMGRGASQIAADLQLGPAANATASTAAADAALSVVNATNLVSEFAAIGAAGNFTPCVDTAAFRSVSMAAGQGCGFVCNARSAVELEVKWLPVLGDAGQPELLAYLQRFTPQLQCLSGSNMTVYPAGSDVPDLPFFHLTEGKVQRGPTLALAVLLRTGREMTVRRLVPTKLPLSQIVRDAW
jgi:hypothetical protein